MQHFKIDQVRVAGQRAGTLVGGFTVSGGPYGQHLPQVHAAVLQKIDPLPGAAAQGADAFRPGKRCDVQQYTALPFPVLIHICLSL